MYYGRRNSCSCSVLLPPLYTLVGYNCLVIPLFLLCIVCSSQILFWSTDLSNINFYDLCLLVKLFRIEHSNCEEVIILIVFRLVFHGDIDTQFIVNADGVFRSDIDNKLPILLYFFVWILHWVIKMINIQVCTLLQTNEAFRSSFFMLFVVHHRCLMITFG